MRPPEPHLAQTLCFSTALATTSHSALPSEAAMHGAPAGRLAQVDVSLALSDEDLTLAIEDDGPAFDPKGEILPLEFFEPMVRSLFAFPKRSLYAAVA